MRSTLLQFGAAERFEKPLAHGVKNAVRPSELKESASHPQSLAVEEQCGFSLADVMHEI